MEAKNDKKTKTKNDNGIKKQNKARETMIEMFVNSLKEGNIPWRQGWDAKYDAPRNGTSGRFYHGVNVMMLTFVGAVREYDDPRWCTFKQAKENGWKIKRGEHGTPVEYWLCYDKKNGKYISMSEYNQMQMNHEDVSHCIPASRVTHVFNAKQIDGIPKYVREEQPKIQSTPLIDSLIQEMGVQYSEMGNKAFYSPAKDMVVVPKRDAFYSEYDYNATRLHELCHATGHDSRLNRDMKNQFGTKEYAKEELRAEISAAFIGQSFGLSTSQSNLENHQAYIQSWIEVLEKEPQELFRAISDATEIENYVLEKVDKELVRQGLKETNKEEMLLDVVYALYKEDWVNTHVSKELQDAVYQEFKEDLSRDEKETFEEYLEDTNGFHGELYASKEEFEENEYQDIEYIEDMLQRMEREDLFDAYCEECGITKDTDERTR